MNSSPENPDAPDVEIADTAAPAETPKPARRRRAPAAPEAAAEAIPVEAAAEAAAPKPRRRKAAAEAAPSEPAGESPAAPAEPVAQAAEPSPAASAPEAPPVVTAQQPDPAGAPDAGTPAPTPVAADGEGVGPDGEPRSERSRRRNRRDRRRGEGREGGAPANTEGNPEAPQRPPMPDTGEVFAQVLAGAFDVEDEPLPEPEQEPAEHRRVLAPEPESPKLHKVLAQAGIGSRRDMEEMILEGRISVNGQPAHIGQRISFGDQVKVNGKPVRFRIVPPPPRVIAYHKPVGEVVTHDDPQQRPTVFRRLPRLQQGKWQSVGRLDINTEGLLLFTNSGELANQLMHPRFGVEREYAVRVLGTLNEEQRAKLIEGVEIDGQTAGFRSIEDGGGEGANHWYRVVITEGRNREVRKLFDAVGMAVSRLIRIRYGTVVLPRGLKRGVWVDLDENDVRTIRRLAGGDRQPQPQQPQQRDNDRRNDRPNDRGDRNNDRPGNGGPGKKQRGDNRPQQRPNDRPPQPMPPQDERRDGDDDFDGELDIDPSRIPNPLEQTFDKRFVQKPRSGVGGRGFSRGGGGFGAGGSAPQPAGKKRGPGPQQPDPMQTSVGYIGADAFHRKNRGGGGGGGGGRSGGGGFGGFGGGGRKGR